MRVLCSVIVVAGFTIVAIIGVFNVLSDLLAMITGGEEPDVHPGFGANEATFTDRPD